MKSYSVNLPRHPIACKSLIIICPLYPIERYGGSECKEECQEQRQHTQYILLPDCGDQRERTRIACSERSRRYSSWGGAQGTTTVPSDSGASCLCALPGLYTSCAGRSSGPRLQGELRLSVPAGSLYYSSLHNITSVGEYWHDLFYVLCVAHFLAVFSDWGSSTS